MQKKGHDVVFLDISKREGKKGMRNLMSQETALYGRLTQKDNAQPYLIPWKTLVPEYTYRGTFCAKKTVNISTKLLKS